MAFKLSILSIIVVVILTVSCSNQEKKFELLKANHTGVDFSNDLLTNDTLNSLFFEYIYNGAGVAAADVNNDGLTDLFFTGNQVSSRLYLNRGDFVFEDVTLPAGIKTDRWCTGVAIVDINNDGKHDIYISVAGYKVPDEKMENLLFINEGWDEKGIPVFREMAKSYGLNDGGYSTQAAFMDYDHDGDLDMYLLTNALEKYNRNNLRPKQTNGQAASTDRLYRNNGDLTFSNVSKEAGILIEGYGLGVKVADLNFDNYPDIYVSNDFLSNDLVWINNKNGTFTNQASVYLKHQTHNGMGLDIADFNNDALPDIAVLDMLPEDNYRQKMMIPYVNYGQFGSRRHLGYEDEYMRNTVQLHQGFAPDGTPRYSEIGNLLGLSATDWSWSVLFADFDNDGWKDTYITNGYRKDVTNLDYINYSSFSQVFGTDSSKQERALRDLSKTPDVLVANYIFQNKKNLKFENVSNEWGLDQLSYSNGAVYADFDNDGDLDLAVNNIDSKAFIYKNKTEGNNYIQIKLESSKSNALKYNAKVIVYSDTLKQYQEFSPFRGYKSTVDEILHFGMGDHEIIDSIVVYWLDGSKSKLGKVGTSQRVVIKHEQHNSNSSTYMPQTLTNHNFDFIEDSLGINFIHSDLGYSDLRNIRTLPHDHAKSGPAMATGDVNGDGLEDFFIGGNKDQSGAFFIQNIDGRFERQNLLIDSRFQDVGAHLFDADGDSDLDLYIVSGGSYTISDSTAYQDRLYMNDGNGDFQRSHDALPIIGASGSCVISTDYDNDGDLDLFVGGRIIPGQYPIPPRSYFLKNEGGIFIDETPLALQNIGLVTEAVWADVDGDKNMDLLVVGEWMKITLIKNEDGILSETPITINGNTNESYGWWMHINAADIDEDGDTDFVIGNLGLNSKLQASYDEPVRLYAKDFDNNGTIDPLLSCFIQGKEHLVHERDLLINQIPTMKRRFSNYSDYARATLRNSLSQEDLENTIIKKSSTFSSIILENNGDYNFTTHELPRSSQLSPIMGSWVEDLNKNGSKEILTIGNFHATETTQIGLYDASYGNITQQTSSMVFNSSNTLNSNLVADDDIRNLKTLQLRNGGTLILLGVYGGRLKTYIWKGKE